MSARPVKSSEITDAATLRRAFSSFATGVTVVTTGGVTPHGMTANSFASVSLDPPLVLICVDRAAVMHQRLSAAGCFAVSVLAAGQEILARHFADQWRPLSQAQFDGLGWRPGPHTGAPLLDGAIAHFECRVWREYAGGDHTIFVGSPVAMDWRAGEDGLLFFRGRFGQALTDRVGGT
ncbi:MAG TPA: flavin reductase family protein [Micromonosporaceae bacterium]|nr:flavin reductase family protein [Micromonosporaceae bacterium]